MPGKDNPGCLFAFLRIFMPGSKSSAGDQSLPYRLTDRFLSPAEISFYHALKSVVGDNATICSKVNLADIIKVAAGTDNWRSFNNRIDRKHADFLLCDPKTMRPLLAIELDDSSHNKADRKERDIFVDEVFQAAQLPLVHVPVRDAYQVSELSALVGRYITPAPTAPAPQQHSAPTMPTIDCARPTAPICPKCNIPLVLRTAGKGEKHGEQTWGCQNYPRCRERVVL